MQNRWIIANYFGISICSAIGGLLIQYCCAIFSYCWSLICVNGFSFVVPSPYTTLASSTCSCNLCNRSKNLATCIVTSNNCAVLAEYSSRNLIFTSFNGVPSNYDTWLYIIFVQVSSCCIYSRVYGYLFIVQLCM